MVARETIELTFVAVIQVLPPRQRAVLILRDVLEWTARATAELLDMTVAAANSALQRARETVRDLLPRDRSGHATEDLTDDERRLLDAFIDAHERGDAEKALAVVREDIRIHDASESASVRGPRRHGAAARAGFGPESEGEWLLVPTRANRQPTAASYLRAHGDTEYRAFKLDVIRVEDGAIAEITTFGASLFPQFGLPPVWPAGR